MTTVINIEHYPLPSILLDWQINLVLVVRIVPVVLVVAIVLLVRVVP